MRLNVRRNLLFFWKQKKLVLRFFSALIVLVPNLIDQQKKGVNPSLKTLFWGQKLSRHFRVQTVTRLNIFLENAVEADCCNASNLLGKNRQFCSPRIVRARRWKKNKKKYSMDVFVRDSRFCLVFRVRNDLRLCRSGQGGTRNRRAGRCLPPQRSRGCAATWGAPNQATLIDLSSTKSLCKRDCSQVWR